MYGAHILRDWFAWNRNVLSSLCCVLSIIESSHSQLAKKHEATARFMRANLIKWSLFVMKKGKTKRKEKKMLEENESSGEQQEKWRQIKCTVGVVSLQQVIRSGGKMKKQVEQVAKLFRFSTKEWACELGREGWAQEVARNAEKLLLPLYRVALRQVSSLNIDSNGSSFSGTHTRARTHTHRHICSRAHHYKRPNWCKNSSLLRLHNSLNSFNVINSLKQFVVCMYVCVRLCIVSSIHTLCRQFLNCCIA